MQCLRLKLQKIHWKKNGEKHMVIKPRIGKVKPLLHKLYLFSIFCELALIVNVGDGPRTDRVSPDVSSRHSTDGWDPGIGPDQAWWWWWWWWWCWWWLSTFWKAILPNANYLGLRKAEPICRCKTAKLETRRNNKVGKNCNKIHFWVFIESVLNILMRY